MTKDTITIRFFKGKSEIGEATPVNGQTIFDGAEDAEVNISRNCASGTCGTCLVTLMSGHVSLPDDTPPGLDEYLISEGGILSCFLSPSSSCEIDVRPPL